MPGVIGLSLKIKKVYISAIQLAASNEQKRPTEKRKFRTLTLIFRQNSSLGVVL